MIQQVTRHLGIASLSVLLKQVQLDLDGEEMADVLWLAIQMGEAEVTSTVETAVEEPQTAIAQTTIETETADSQPTPPPVYTASSQPSVPAYLPSSSLERLQEKTVSQGIPFKAPAAPGLRNSLALARALRPLMRKVPSQTKTVLDEEETVTQIAEKGIWTPVLKPAPERWLDLALVVEESRSIAIWQETISELQRLTELQGAFRYVCTWSLKTDENAEIKLYPRQNVSANKQRPRSHKELLDPAGRRLVLLISDCTSVIWRQGKIHDLLKLWSHSSPLAIVQLLPERLWMRTAMGIGFPVQLSALAPGVPNTQLMVDGLPVWEDVNVANAITVPVITLEPDSLQQWSRVVAGVGSTKTAGILFEPSLVAAQSQTSMDTPQLSAAELVKRFQATASPLARRLAGLMAAVPVSLPVVHLIQETLLKESMQVHVAEIFMSGLLQPLTSDSVAPKGEIVQYKFVEGVRELLIDSVPIPDVDEVLEVVSQYIARRVGLSIKNFTALLSPNTDWDKATQQEIIPFAQIATQVLRRLGGEYAALAEQLERKSPFIAKPPDNNLPKLQTFEFEVATITIEDGAETPVGIDLQPFEFEVAVIEVNQSAQINTGSPLEIVDETVFTKTGQHLNKIEQLILQGTLANQTYEQISASAQYSVLHLKNVAFKLWEVLSEVLGEKVTKTNLQNVLQQWAARRHLTIHRHPQQAQEFIEDLGNGVQLEMVAIPSGSFVMGSPKDEPKWRSSESPQHTVTIKPFLLGTYPVTQAQWQTVASLPQVNRKLDPDPSRFKGKNRPVERVSWYDAIEFCDRLSQYTGKPYRLPSEAEWEYACRAGTTTPFHFGETITSELANYDAKYTYGAGVKGVSRGETTPVGSFGVANAFGLYDMHGQVWEWCADHWHSNYEGAPIDGSAWLEHTDNDNRQRLLRGGSWYTYPAYCRSAFRLSHDAGDRLNHHGFRVVCAAAWT